VVKLNTPGYKYPIAVEYQISGYSSVVTDSPGPSFVSNDRDNGGDLTVVWDATANVCRQGFTAGTNGNLDLIWSDMSTGATYIWYMNGVTHTGMFTSAP
jgi:hypothetical protein